jgi:hypothetical protein
MVSRWYTALQRYKGVIMRKKIYQAIAGVIQEQTVHNTIGKPGNFLYKADVVGALCKLFAEDNEWFDEEKFRQTCEGKQLV